MTGKSSAAIHLASKIEYACMSTDDIGESLRARIKNTRLNPILGFDYREYYTAKTVAQLIDDTMIQHKEIWPSVKAVIRAHSDWGKPLVLEGWNLYPRKTEKLNDQNIMSFWLTADKALLRSRIEQNRQFYKGAGNIELLIENYLERSIWHNNLIRTEAGKLGKPVIEVTASTNKEDLTDIMLQAIQENEKT